MNTSRAAHLTRLRLIILAAAVAIAGLFIPASQIASAHATTAVRTSYAGAAWAKPAIVLEHGSWADGSSWNAVIRACSAPGTPSTLRRTRCAACPTTPPLWPTSSRPFRE